MSRNKRNVQATINEARGAMRQVQLQREFILQQEANFKQVLAEVAEVGDREIANLRADIEKLKSVKDLLERVPDDDIQEMIALAAEHGIPEGATMESDLIRALNKATYEAATGGGNESHATYLALLELGGVALYWAREFMNRTLGTYDSVEVDTSEQPAEPVSNPGDDRPSGEPGVQAAGF